MRNDVVASDERGSRRESSNVPYDFRYLLGSQNFAVESAAENHAYAKNLTAWYRLDVQKNAGIAHPHILGVNVPRGMISWRIACHSDKVPSRE